MSESFRTIIHVASTPKEAFAAISRPQEWWNPQIAEPSEAVGDEFGFDEPGLHRTRLRVVEAAPGRRIVWRVVENHFGFVEDQEEWVGTDIVFDIEPGEHGVTVTLTHVGLVPEFECYSVCAGAWTYLLGSNIRQMLATV